MLNQRTVAKPVFKYSKELAEYALVHHLALAMCIFGHGQVICPHVQVFLRMYMLPSVHISANVKS